MRCVAILAVLVLALSTGGCASEGGGSVATAPAPKLSRRDARIAASRLRHAERQAKAAEARTSGQARRIASATGSGAGAGSRRHRDAELPAAGHSTSVTTLAEEALASGPVGLIDELERLWMEVNALRSDGRMGQPEFTSAVEALYELAEWSVEQFDARADEASAEGRSRKAALHYMRAAQCLMKAALEADGGWIEKADEQRELARELAAQVRLEGRPRRQ